MFWPLTFLSPLRPKPLSQRFQIGGVHPQYDLFPMAAVDGKDVIFVKDHRIAQMKFVQSGFVQRVVHDSFGERAVTLGDSHPKVLAPSSCWHILLR